MQRHHHRCLLKRSGCRRTRIFHVDHWYPFDAQPAQNCLPRNTDLPCDNGRCSIARPDCLYLRSINPRISERLIDRFMG